MPGATRPAPPPPRPPPPPPPPRPPAGAPVFATDRHAAGAPPPARPCPPPPAPAPPAPRPAAGAAPGCPAGAGAPHRIAHSTRLIPARAGNEPVHVPVPATSVIEKSTLPVTLSLT